MKKLGLGANEARDKIGGSLTNPEPTLRSAEKDTKK